MKNRGRQPRAETSAAQLELMALMSQCMQRHPPEHGGRITRRSGIRMAGNSTPATGWGRRRRLRRDADGMSTPQVLLQDVGRALRRMRSALRAACSNGEA